MCRRQPASTEAEVPPVAATAAGIVSKILIMVAPPLVVECLGRGDANLTEGDEPGAIHLSGVIPAGDHDHDRDSMNR
jgi:hypothetical protein